MPAKNPWNTPPIEVPPSSERGDNCSEPGCGNPSFSKGLCRSHYHKNHRAQGGGKRPVPSAEPLPEVTQKEVESMVVTAMQFLASTIDESFAALDIKQKPTGEVDTMEIKPHVREAVTEMMPWMRKYGGSMVKYAPWFGLIGGCIALAAPAIDPVTEIIAGVRKPRMARRPTPTDPDLYTDAYKAAQRAREHKEAQKQANGAGQTRASDAVVPTSAVTQ